MSLVGLALIRNWTMKPGILDLGETRMKSINCKVILIGVLLAASAVPAHAGSEYTDSQVTEFTQGGRIEIKLSAGEHQIVQSKDHHIRVHWILEDERKTVKARTDVEGNSATIDVNGPRKNFETVIEVPENSDITVRLSAGTLAIQDLGGDRDINLRAGELKIEVGDAENYGKVEGSLWAGDIDAGPFNKEKSGLFRSFDWQGDGEEDLKFKLYAGDVRLYSDKK
jgi:hypothetical protein